MSPYGIISDLRREHPTPPASKTLDLVVSALGRSRDNLKAALASIDDHDVPPGGRPVLDELEARARAAGVDDLERPPAPDETLPVEPLDDSQVGIAVLLGGTAFLATALAVLAVGASLNQILHFI